MLGFVIFVERQIVLQVLERLVTASEETQVASETQQYQPIPASNYYYASGFGHKRSQTFPISLRRGHLPHRHGLRTKIKCRHCSARGLEKKSQKSGGSSGGGGRREDESGIGALVGKRITVHSTK